MLVFRSDVEQSYIDLHELTKRLKHVKSSARTMTESPCTMVYNYYWYSNAVKRGTVRNRERRVMFSQQIWRRGVDGDAGDPRRIRGFNCA